MAPSNADDVDGLNSIVATALTLFTQLQEVLEKIHHPPPPQAATYSETQTETPEPDDRLDAFEVAADCSRLVRAHCTKIALLITNEPYSPRAVTSVVKVLAQSPVSGLVSAVQLCTREDYTVLVRKELAFRCNQVISRVIDLCKWIPLDGRVVPESKRSSPIIGMLWNACDEVVKLTEMGVSGLFVKKILQWKDMLKDMSAELKEWSAEDPDDENDEDDDDAVSDDEAQAMADELMNGPPPIPHDDPDEIRPRLNVAIKRLGLMALFYDAIIKRRIKTVPNLPPATPGAAILYTERLDELATVLQSLPERFEEHIQALYDFDGGYADETTDAYLVGATTAEGLVMTDWEGEEDEFSAWTTKFQKELKRCALADGITRKAEPAE
ncbi:Ran-binding-domain-containing protein [Purpureocillium lavendulum]|uniref:Ran-binding-domain-containing protein n=1 Tax=Purpureocillium lavendulum TaxID=1247861 RepID=A0AB34FLJ0_9HYPO|nr:Ran-binding-domain-containing protein [Purpureocillium lavendulum]